MKPVLNLKESEGQVERLGVFCLFSTQVHLAHTHLVQRKGDLWGGK